MVEDPRLDAIRRAVRREWKGWEEPDHPDKGLHRAGEFLAGILKQAGAAEGVDEERLREAWVEIAGEFVSRHAAPVSLKGGCLTLRVAQPTVRFELEQMRGDLLRRLREASAGAVKTIRFSLG